MTKLKKELIENNNESFEGLIQDIELGKIKILIDDDINKYLLINKYISDDKINSLYNYSDKFINKIIYFKAKENIITELKIV